MAFAAGRTTKLKFGTSVLVLPGRNPALLAKELATLDVLSEGRLDVAIGAGWNRAEYDAIGLPFDPIRVRQARLAESIAVSGLML